jgi:hypothetical protein
MEKSSEGY